MEGFAHLMYICIVDWPTPYRLMDSSYGSEKAVIGASWGKLRGHFSGASREANE